MLIKAQGSAGEKKSREGKPRKKAEEEKMKEEGGNKSREKDLKTMRLKSAAERTRYAVEWPTTGGHAAPRLFAQTHTHVAININVRLTKLKTA